VQSERVAARPVTRLTERLARRAADQNVYLPLFQLPPTQNLGRRGRVATDVFVNDVPIRTILSKRPDSVDIHLDGYTRLIPSGLKPQIQAAGAGEQTDHCTRRREAYLRLTYDRLSWRRHEVQSTFELSTTQDHSIALGVILACENAFAPTSSIIWKEAPR